MLSEVANAVDTGRKVASYAKPTVPQTIIIILYCSICENRSCACHWRSLIYNSHSNLEGKLCYKAVRLLEKMLALEPIYEHRSTACVPEHQN